MMWKNDWQTVLNAAVHHGTTNPWRRVQSMEYGCNPGWVWAVENMRTLCAWWSGDLRLCSIAFYFCFLAFCILFHCFFCIIFLAALATQLLHAGRVKKGSRTRKTHGRVDRRVPPLHVLHVCVCVYKCHTMTECQFIRCHNLWHQLLRRISITNDSQRWLNRLSHIIILFCWF